MRKVKILGAGPSGLAAAINLAKAGYGVEVFEKNSDCGMRFNGDMQGLENWSEDIDVLDSLADMHIETNFETTPFRKVSFSNCEITEELFFEKPLFYLVKRGNIEGSLDLGLKQQAIAAGAKLIFNKTIEENEADIVGTGPRFKNVVVADKGIIFKTDLPNMAIAVVNDQAAFKGYSYLLIVDGYACLCTCIFDSLEKLNDCFDFTKQYFVKKYKLKIRDPQAVGGVGYFSIHNIYKKGKTLFVGEAAGIQDFLAGFGMRTAIASGYLAAESIIKDMDYAELADNKFKKHLEAGITNRYTWEHSEVNNYIAILDKLKNIEHKTDFLRSIYNFNLIERFEYPLALAYIRKQYPEIIE